MRFCNTPGCRAMVVHGYCPACRAKRRAAWRHPDTMSAQTFTGVLLPADYGREWQRRRKRFLADHPFCIDCIAEGRPTGLAVEVDHRIPHRGDRVLFWDEHNWQGLCKPHHSAKTAREVALGGASMSRTPSNRPHVPNRFVICGPSGTGKSTWVKQRARPWDLVWDLDDVAAVIGHCGEPIPRAQRGALPWPIMKASLIMRDALIAWLSATDLYSMAVYVIVSDTADATAIAKQIGAQLVPLTLGVAKD